MICIPLQVVSDYLSEMDMQSRVGGDAGAQAVVQERIARQRGWLKRGRATTAADLKPQKRHRKAAFQWLMSLHNQVWYLTALRCFPPPWCLCAISRSAFWVI